MISHRVRGLARLRLLGQGGQLRAVFDGEGQRLLRQFLLGNFVPENADFRRGLDPQAGTGAGNRDQFDRDSHFGKHNFFIFAAGEDQHIWHPFQKNRDTPSDLNERRSTTAKPCNSLAGNGKNIPQHAGF